MNYQPNCINPYISGRFFVPQVKKRILKISRHLEYLSVHEDTGLGARVPPSVGHSLVLALVGPLHFFQGTLHWVVAMSRQECCNAKRCCVSQARIFI